MSNQSLNVITKTGDYIGNNVPELVPYVGLSTWCIMRAHVQSDNAASITVITNDKVIIDIYRESDGTYKIYPLALKSDLAGFRILTAGRSSRFFTESQDIGYTETQTIPIPNSGQSVAYALVTLNLSGDTADAVAIRTLDVSSTSFSIHCKLLWKTLGDVYVYADYVVLGK